jgi:hypothetical protein
MRKLENLKRESKMDDKTKGLDLAEETTKSLEDLLYNELYMDIDSEFAIEIQKELDKRANG